MMESRKFSGSLKKGIFGFVLMVLPVCGVLFAQEVTEVPKFSRISGGYLNPVPDQYGNRIPDFSYCGYKSSNVPIPDLPVTLVVPRPEEDATILLQSAIDHVASLIPGPNGFRGVILLEPGIYRLKGRLTIRESGIIIRGSGMDEQGTTLLAEGVDRMTLIRISGKDDRRAGPEYDIKDSFVPVNAFQFRISDAHTLSSGERIMVQRPSTPEWIDLLGMNEFGGETEWLGWKPGQRDICWYRTVTAVDGDMITVDAPLTMSLDKNFGGGKVIPFKWYGRISHIGIENLRLQSAYDRTNPKDESHCWMAVTFENCEDSWVRQVRFRHFAGSAVAIYETAGKITVKDCISESPVSEIGGGRRYTFFNMGQQCLFTGLYSENGYHDFATGFCSAGPNAFVECESGNSYSFSGAIDSWATGILFDIVSIDGNRLSFKNRGQDAQGAGWCAANSMFWQCSASWIDCHRPPTAFNWAYGSWAQYTGDGYWEETDSHISPRSLFYAQLAQRLNLPLDSFRNEYRPALGGSTTSPSPELAEEMTRLAYENAFTVKDYILTAPVRDPISADRSNADVFDRVSAAEENSSVEERKRVGILNGVIFSDGLVLSGGRASVPWWRGDPRPYAARVARPAITRFVPGRYGHGYTDDPEQVCTILKAGNMAGLEHNYGLWYDRRRDDHQRIRRMDGDVWAPFYELPFARSGIGIAWDGLSRYDLTQYNPWYWSRLKAFADAAEENGLLLLQHHYFQHNILEAGAHYADFPWRSANNINDTGFPEPPNYAGDKRIFMDEQFYDIGHEVRRNLHRMYIRKCLENFAGNSNVIHLVSAEYTGPLHFVQFWLDVIAEWQEETGHDPLVALSTTKDVQDSILADPLRSGVIDIIDIRYWGYRTDGTLYAPEGGKHLAPRQHARLVDPGRRGFEEVYRAVREYRVLYPDKAVIYSENSGSDQGWAVVMAGGSLPQLPADLSDEFLINMGTMEPVESGRDDGEEWIMRNRKGDMIIYYNSPDYRLPDLNLLKRRKQVEWIDPLTGETISGFRNVLGRGRTVIERPRKSPVVLWLH
ncbi:MAG: pectate lyase [Bacteroidales bacterium]|nr:pectate lyase [Bacteroidales bacterium]